VKKKSGTCSTSWAFALTAEEYLQAMASEEASPPLPFDVGRFAALRADRQLLEADAPLPAQVGRPEHPERWALRGAVVGTGAALTGISLVAGIVLIAIGIVHALSSGLGLGPLAIPVVGLLLLATHWGWVHVAEATAGAIEGRRGASVEERNTRWLEAIEPYERWEVSTEADTRGVITLMTTRFTPAPIGEGGFTFTREVVAREEHAADAPAEVVSERTEVLRHEAAERTRSARLTWEAAREAYELAKYRQADEEERLAAARAAAAALSDRLNAHLNRPPLED
jgi:hypothetical protein